MKKIIALLILAITASTPALARPDDLVRVTDQARTASDITTATSLARSYLREIHAAFGSNIEGARWQLCGPVLVLINANNTKRAAVSVQKTSGGGYAVLPIVTPDTCPAGTA